MNEKITMTTEQWEGHVSKDILPGRFKFIEKAAAEGRLIKVDQEQGVKLAKCPECGRNHAEVERTVRFKDKKPKVVFGKIFIITFVIDTGKRKEIEGK